MVVTGDDGGDVEVATIGNEGVIGLGGLLAGDVSFSRQVVHLEGHAMRIPLALSRCGQSQPPPARVAIGGLQRQS